MLQGILAYASIKQMRIYLGPEQVQNNKNLEKII